MTEFPRCYSCGTPTASGTPLDPLGADLSQGVLCDLCGLERTYEKKLDVLRIENARLTLAHERLNTDLSAWVHRQAELQAEIARLEGLVERRDAEIVRLSEAWDASLDENERLNGELTRRMSAIPYDRTSLVDVLIHHWPTATSGCSCGWAALGHSFPEHLADTYERALHPA